MTKRIVQAIILLPLFLMHLLWAGMSVAVAADSATESTVSRGVLVLPLGTEFTITDISPDDAYYPFRADFIDKVHVVATGARSSQLVSYDGGTWWAGPATAPEGGRVNEFFKIKIFTTVTPTPVADKIPDFVSFHSVLEAVAGTQVTSAPATIKGIDADTTSAITISGGEYSIDGGPFTSAAGSVALNQQVVLRVTAAAEIGQKAIARLYFEGQSAGFTPDSFSVTTTQAAGDLVPDAFSFVAVSNVAPGASVISAAITVRGINAATAISIKGGEYSVDGRAFTTLGGTVVLGSQVRVRLAAPATANTTASATLTIGGVAAAFTVTTQSYPTITAPTQIFSNPQTTTVQNGTALLETAPTQPLQIATDAQENAIIVVKTADPIPVVSGAATLTYTRRTDDATLQVRTIGGTPGLQVTTGQFDITAPTTGSSVPVAGGAAGSATLVTQSVNTQVTAGPDANRNLLFAISSGQAKFRSTTRGRALPSEFDVYAGEAVLTDDNGEPGLLRFGSFAQDAGQAGDFIADVPLATTGLQVPIVKGTPTRFNEPLLTVLARALASHYQLGTGATLTQSSQTGVLTLSVAGKKYRFLPIGALGVNLTRTRAISTADIAANLQSIVAEGMAFAVAPATSYSDLNTLLKQIDPAAALEILADGAILATIGGTQYSAQPAPLLVPGGVTAAGFDQVDGQLALRDPSGNRQVLYPAFANTDFLLSTFRAEIPELQVGNAGPGVYSVSLPGINLSAFPDIVITTPEPGKMWWVDATGRIFIRYPNSTAQGFTLQ